MKCDSYQLNYLQVNFTDLQNKELIKLRTKSIQEALKLKQLLCSHQINIVTIESVTSGLIASTLTDVSQGGSYLYGGLVVYDIDAKRKWADVTTPNVYNKVAAKQMAEGTLKNSRAIISIAISGNATPYKDSLDCLGVCHLGVSIRGKDGIHTKVKRINVCKNIETICKKWKNDHEKNTYPKLKDTMFINNIVRYLFTIEALTYTFKVLESYKKPFGFVNEMPYDTNYLDYYEPSDIINNHLKNRFFNRKWQTYEKQNSLCLDKRSKKTTKVKKSVK